MSPSWTDRQSGFSLLEMLVAFVILSLSLGVIMRLFSTSLNQIGRAEQIVHAVTVAESALAGLGTEVPLQEGEHDGADEQGYRWHIQVGRSADGDASVDTAPAPVLFEVQVTVRQGDDSGQDRPLVRLTSLRLGPKP